MSRIKSALEIALERTESVKSDRAGIELFELRQEGKRLAGAYLDEPAKAPLEAALKKYPKDKAAAVRQGVYDVLLSQFNLPAVKEDLARLATVGQGLAAIISDRRFGQLLQQVQQAMERYLADVEQYDQAIRQQYAPKLRQKEDELAKRTGRRVQIEPMQDPEFVAFYNQHMGGLRDRYQTAVDQARAMAAELFGA